MDLAEWAKLQESLLKSQLKIIRQFLREGAPPSTPSTRKRRSQMSIIYDILLAARQPLHITEIIERAKKEFDVQMDRESVVSALTKKVKSGRMFKRIAPNTFSLLESAAEDKKQE